MLNVHKHSAAHAKRLSTGLSQDAGMEKLSRIPVSGPQLLLVTMSQEALRSVSFSMYQPMRVFAPTAPTAETVAELHPTDGAVEHFQTTFRKLNTPLLCSDGAHPSSGFSVNIILFPV